MSDFGFYSASPLPYVNLQYPQPGTYNVLSPPEELPITLEEVKEQLRIDPLNTDEDSYLTLLIEAAADLFQSYTGRILIATQFELLYTVFTQSKELRKSKLLTLNAFQYSVDGAFQDVDPSIYYATFESDYSRVIIADYLTIPDDKDDIFQSIRIDFNAGYGLDSSAIPSDIKLALLQQVSNMYENRGDCNECCASMSSLPSIAKMIYNKYRIKSIYGASWRGG